MRKLVIIGAGGFGREVCAWAMQSTAFTRSWEIKGLIDDNTEALRGRSCPVSILGRIAEYEPQSDDVFVCAIGQPHLKRRCMEMIVSRGGEFVNVIHRTAVFAHDVRLGCGVILCPYSVVSDGVTLADGVALNLHVTVDHDVKVGRWCQINCHSDLTGGVTLEDEVLVGSHAAIMPGVRLGAGVRIGAGAIVMGDVVAGTTMAATPARPMRL